MNKTPEQIIELVRNAGVVGAGGAGFPTYLKLQAKVDTVIINGSECEPLLYSDKALLLDRPGDVIEGLKSAMKATGAKEGVIAVNGHYRNIADSIQKIISSPDQNIRVHLLNDYYPAGDEFLMVYDITKKVIPEGGLPTAVGVSVINAMTAAQIHHAVNGKPVTERLVTITGEVHEPKVVQVPIGTPYSELIKLAGGSKLKNYAVLDGGPMMGNLISQLENGISKTTTGIIILPLDHFVIQMKTKSSKQMVKLSKAACCQCSQCTDLCPRNLLGHEINPDLAMRSIDYNMSEPSSHVTSAFLCSQCGLCELVACDSKFLSPKKIYAEFKKQLIQAGIKNPHQRSGFSVHSQFENRKVSTEMLMKKLGISHYYAHLPMKSTANEMPIVKIPTQRHKGAPSIVTVNIGQQVRRGDVISMSPADQQGSIYHASMHGKISDITESFVEITGQLS